MVYNGYMLFQKKIEGFRYAFAGIAIAWREEFSFRFHVLFAVAALVLAWLLQLSRTEFLIILGMIGLVLASEVLNTALEELCDKFQPTHDPHIAKIKDLGAGAVFIASVTAFVAGCIIFIPHFISLFL